MTITEITLAALIVVQWLTVVRQNKEINHRRECERLLKEKLTIMNYRIVGIVGMLKAKQVISSAVWKRIWMSFFF